MDADLPVYVFGAGGHARVVIATLEASGRRVAGCFDDARRGGVLDGVPVLGPIQPHLPLDGPLVIAVGDNATRRAIAGRLGGSVAWACAVHPSATVHRTVQVGEGTVVFAGAVVQPGCRLGAHAIVNTAATADHDCTVGEFAHLGPGVHLAGDVVIGAGSLIGVGASVAPGCRVGDRSVVGAGAAVARAVPPGVVAAGVPARVLRVLPPAAP